MGNTHRMPLNTPLVKHVIKACALQTSIISSFPIKPDRISLSGHTSFPHIFCVSKKKKKKRSDSPITYGSKKKKGKKQNNESNRNFVYTCTNDVLENWQKFKCIKLTEMQIFTFKNWLVLNTPSPSNIEALEYVKSSDYLERTNWVYIVNIFFRISGSLL